MLWCATKLALIRLFCVAAQASHQYTVDVPLVVPSFFPVSVVRASLLWDDVEMPQSGPNGLEVSGPKIMARSLFGKNLSR